MLTNAICMLQLCDHYFLVTWQLTSEVIFFPDNCSHISYTHYLLCIEWKSNYSVQGNCFIYLQARNCMINPKKITTKIEKAFSNHFSANKINVGQEKYSHYPFLKSHKDIGEKEVIKAQLFIPKKKNSKSENTFEIQLDYSPSLLNFEQCQK